MLAESRAGVICTPHSEASAAGMRVLDAGGTAIDAMLAASAMLSAVYPHMTGLGGDALWMIHDRRVRTIVGIGQAGQLLPDGGVIGLRGPSAVATTAGALASWQTAHNISRGEWSSRMGWQDLLGEAAQVARAGAEVSESHLFWQQQRQALIEAESQHVKDDDTDDAEEDEINYDNSEQKQDCARVEPKRGDEQTTGESSGELVLPGVAQQSIAETDEVALGRSVADACVALRSRTDGLERKRVVLSHHMSSLLDFAQKESSLDVQPVLDAISSQIRNDKEYVEQRIQPLLTRLKETLTDMLSLYYFCLLVLQLF